MCFYHLSRPPKCPSWSESRMGGVAFLHRRLGRYRQELMPQSKITLDISLLLDLEVKLTPCETVKLVEYFIGWSDLYSLAK
mmetsp:Transcript_28019/g.71621  ORF Transcript_28019/g.71621 Transcript_28019/m.71621 type:complete len:81 (+) Transcript_28019:493-735(+)